MNRPINIITTKFRFSLLIFITIFLIYAISAKEETPYDYFTRLSDAFLHGKLYLEEHPSWLNELISVDDKYYVVYPPMPAIVMLPLSLFSNGKFSQTLFSILLGAINAALVYILMRQLQLSKQTSFLVVSLFALGTNHWFLSSVGSAWYLAHIVALFFLLLALIETFGNGRLLLIGFLLGISFWSRTTEIFTMPFFYIYFYKKFLPLNKTTFLNFLYLNFGIIIFIILDFIYNYVRFESLSPLTPYGLIPNISHDQVFRDGFMNLNFIFRHIDAVFFRLPQFSGNFPYLIPSLYSTAIWFTTPALVYIFRAKINKIVLACWAAIIPTMFIIFLWAGVGYSQFGYRFIQDVMPFLLILTAWGIGLKPTKKAYLLITVGILINFWGISLINRFNLYVI